MNKKGWVNANGMITLFILILVVAVLASMQNGLDTSSVDRVIETLNWDRFGQNISISLQRSANGTDSDLGKTVISIADRAVNFMGYTVFEVSKYAMRFARDNPNIVNYKVLLFLIFASLIAPLIWPAFMIIISIVLIIKEAVKIRKEKKELKAIKERNQDG